MEIADAKAREPRIVISKEELRLKANMRAGMKKLMVTMLAKPPTWWNRYCLHVKREGEDEGNFTKAQCKAWALELIEEIKRMGYIINANFSSYNTYEPGPSLPDTNYCLYISKFEINDNYGTWKQKQLLVPNPTMKVSSRLGERNTLKRGNWFTRLFWK